MQPLPLHWYPANQKELQNNDAVAMDERVMAVAGNDSSAVAVYEGILPAADGPGIQYVLSVGQCRSRRRKRLHAGNNLSGCRRPRKEQKLYFQRKERSYPERRRQQEENSHQTDSRDDGDTPVYFVVVNDTTLRLVNDSLQEAVSDLNYDIIQVK